MVLWHLTIDANDPTRLARFWQLALGYEPQPPPDGHASWRATYLAWGVPEDELADMTDDDYDRIQPPDGHGPKIWFQIVPETKAGKNRLHLDLYPTLRDRSLPIEERRRLVDTRVAELVAAGASIGRVNDQEEGYYAVLMHDPEGNEFCVA
ncbi:VOC family protein [Nocardioides mangrovi]|uniref:VOC family protein n=1 Tax=Nocardioides mangrovi TaxID=2874580 RepID=A0ABS7UIH1_9ACTN|nr:VOC family protein [Nocardioides mangrovi]MBZ5740843.1 VOC family protein [Nocardioides mangrovi]